MSASDGTAISSIAYFPFGATRTGTVNTTREFTGQRLDGTGLYYYNARYYDPQIGRFINADTVIKNPADPQCFNRYSYCLNNPLKYEDPTGHDQIITDIGENDNGETCYSISDGQGNLLAIATGIDDLAQKMSDCDSVSRNVDLPLDQGATDFFNAVTGQVDTPEPSLPEVNIPDTNGGHQSQIITCDTISFTADVASIFCPVISTPAWFVSTGSSIVGQFLTLIDYCNGKATQENLWVDIIDTDVGLIPGPVGAVAAVNQLVYDNQILWGPWEQKKLKFLK